MKKSLVLVLCLSALSGCSDPNEPISSSSSKKNQFTRSFVASCLAGFKQYGVTHLESGMTARDHCECGAKYISDRASEQDIVQVLKGGMSHLQPLIDESSRRCR